jgi:hypothetical protein
MDSINSNTSFTSFTSFSPVKSETVKSTESKKSNHLNISDFESFDSLRIAFENATTFSEQQNFSYVIPLTYDFTTQSYKLQPNSEQIYNYLIEDKKKKKTPMTFDITKSKLYQKRFGDNNIVLSPLTIENTS